ncbi:coxsackievirus and adenovirus receptor-like [Perca fluviatilis]|uniref:coxsackievirus and adenovirus receptor-like n=1 Tax=Perca fluviatilis TaxID=8168 RepID=UPI0019628BD6|nr:coxsackievirus and adenovirus receptor-like [Perca fluviatilis]
MQRMQLVASLSALMAPLILLLILLSGAASELIVVPVHPGDDVTLPCQAAGSSIRAVEWTRPDLEPYIVLLYRDGHLETDNQHPSFKDRVELVDRDLKDGDVSLTLKNVSRHDAGTYECRVKTDDSTLTKRDSNSEPIRIIHLQITEPADLPVVTVHPGDNVILPCWTADSLIRAAEWSRPDQEQEYVLFYRDGHLDPTYQHPSFKDRVELVDRDLKDGDVSLILKNVSSIDAGTYECRVEPAGSRRRKRAIIDSEPIRIFRLQVTEPGSDDRNLSPLGLYIGLAAGVLVLVAAAVGGVLMFKRCNNKRSGEPAADEGSGDLTTCKEYYI